MVGLERSTVRLSGLLYLCFVQVNDVVFLLIAGVVSFLTDGQISSTHDDFCGREYASCLRKLDSASSSSGGGSDQNDRESADGAAIVYRHNFQLNSVDCDMDYTNYT